MDECKNCANADNEYCFACDNGNQFKPITNADRIRSMTDEELAMFLQDIFYISGSNDTSHKWWINWLKAEGGE